MGKKNLEQLFKESFHDFQEVPDEKVWTSIEASLDNKKQKKRAVPIWWGLGGAAAALVIALLAINPFGEEPEQLTKMWKAVWQILLSKTTWIKKTIKL